MAHFILESCVSVQKKKVAIAVRLWQYVQGILSNKGRVAEGSVYSMNQPVDSFDVVLRVYKMPPMGGAGHRGHRAPCTIFATSCESKIISNKKGKKGIYMYVLVHH